MASRMLRMFRAALVLATVLCCLVSSVPQAQATSTEKFPTVTSTIHEGWILPLELYELDTTYASVTNDEEAEQLYWGFGFAVPETAIIEYAYVILHDCYSEMIPAYGDTAFYVLTINVFNSSEALLYSEQVSSASVYGGTDSYGSVDEERCVTSNITEYITVSELNEIEVSLRVEMYVSGTIYFMADAVSVEVSYTTSTPESFNFKYLLIGIPVGFMFAAPLFFLAKANKERSNSTQT